MSTPTEKPVILCVANWDSNVGYAWWLMESFWLRIHDAFNTDYDVLISYPSISTLPEKIASSRIGTIEFNFRVESFYDLSRHMAFIKKHRVHAIYFSDRPTNHWSYLFFRCSGVQKIIVHDHTPGVRTRPNKLRKSLKTALSHIPFLNADAAIGASDYVKERLINVNCFPAHKSFSAPNGLPTPPQGLTPINLHDLLQLPNNTCLIVSTGRASIYKGIDFTLNVIALLVHQKGVKNIHFIYCGDGPDLDLLKEITNALNLDPYVCFMGRVENIQQLLPACDIAFHPSKGEVGYSLSTLEYMQASLAVVVPDNPSVCQAITPNVNGLIYRENDIASAAEQIMTLIDNRELAVELGINGKKIVESKYSLSSTHYELISALTTILKS